MASFDLSMHVPYVDRRKHEVSELDISPRATAWSLREPGVAEKGDRSQHLASAVSIHGTLRRGQCRRIWSGSPSAEQSSQMRKVNLSHTARCHALKTDGLEH